MRSSARDAPGVCVRDEAFVVTRRGEALSGEEERVTFSRLRFGEERVGREVVLEDAIEDGSVGMVEEGLRGADNRFFASKEVAQVKSG